LFRRQELVRFQHCDPAGIVFYPRYVEMINATVEDWFSSIGIDFAEIHKDAAIPAVSLAIEFRLPSRLGETIDLSLKVARLGATSVTLMIQASHSEELRFESVLTLVYISKKDYRSSPWPHRIRESMRPGDSVL
jgi:4-hydroxybenzoyl-CoA thioesterase